MMEIETCNVNKLYMLLLVVGIDGVTGKHEPTDDEADNDARIPNDEAAT